MTWSATWLALTYGVAACNGGPDDAPPDPAPFVGEVTAAQCRKMLDCCDEQELAAVFGGMNVDQTACEEAIENQAAAFFLPSLRRALNAGTASLHEDRVASCVSALDERSCGEFVPTSSADVLRVPGCTDVVEPRRTLSGFCTDDFECDTGFCSHPPADTEGTCKNAPTSGEPCLHDRCADGLRCDTDGVCSPRLEDGETCERNADCRSEVCVSDDTGALTCGAAPPVCEG